MEPRKTIVPLLGINKANGQIVFLGTGSFVGKQPWLLTADHVVRDWGAEFAICVLPETDELYAARVVRRDRDADLAVLQVEGYAPPQALEFGKPENMSPTKLVCTFEYGTTRVIGKKIHLSPATRVGNVTREINLPELYGEGGKGMMELSFPALRGASGAPVVSIHGFELWGIIIANVNYHLLPTQIESVLDEENQVSAETRFMLPQAIAVNTDHAIRIIESLDSGG